MGVCNFNSVFGLFSEYPLTRTFKDPRIPMTVTILSVLVLMGLITFNVLTQGSVSETESILRGHWYIKNSTLSCQPATMVMGNSYFTNAQPNHPEAGEQRGSFSWSLQSVVRGREGRDTGETGFYYQESPLRCNITGISLTYDFQIQSFSYSMRAMCVTPSVEKNTPDNYVSLETRFSILDKAVPRFTEEVQNTLQAQIFGISKYYPELNFSVNALPSTAFPPYTNPNNGLAQQEIGNRDILQWSVWLDGFNYTLPENYQDFNHSHLYMQPEPQGKLYISGVEVNPRIFEQGTLDLLNAGKSGLQIAAVGIGGIRPIPPNATLTEVQLLPAPMPLYLNLTESILAIMMDMAGKDLDKRVLGAGYLCTITRTPWKKAIPMLAMIVGSCSGMFGAALTIILFVARRYDSHLISKQEKRETFDSAVSDNPLTESERDELMLESQTDAMKKKQDQILW
ncbi:uncharacterized protein PGTG_15913 [Puccinia graminis f. sp. tritici CRL 75-36-700-3]|uniref:Uncharacterized protein n=3 Tax=Puccinia graminis f. sp. tritici TaxID=56615 RepID=E3L0G7_PUCGT|nr:uncharacterized protein PGTG_15913 [Puccinia graminis f. sp. tritici CRL 75-36-700-3]EFP90065.2 hypothetical protein PGTG_15913 [Puccinia graminis f. sp. tritici CRL 75-36-700-3]